MRRFGIATAAFLLFGFVASGCASTDWQTKYLQKEQEARALEEQYDSMNQLQAEHQASAEVLRKEMGQTKAQIDALASEITEVQAQPAPAPQPTVDPDYANLRKQYDDLKARYNDVRINDDGNLEITLDSNVTFASGSHKLTTEGRRILDSVAKDLEGTFSTNAIEVIGNTDSDPIRKSHYKDNLELGGERAFEVTRYLATKHGIAPSRMTASSRGDTDPVADNSTKEGKRKNRRVEIVVVIPKKAVAATRSAH
jgi:chemotaxis protein MotB